MSAQTDDQAPVFYLRHIICATCSGKKMTWKRTTRFCSQRCAKKYRRPNGGGAWTPLRACTHCGTEFEPLLILHSLCSDACREAVRPLKAAEKRREIAAAKEAEKQAKANAAVVKACVNCDHFTVLPPGVSETGGMCARSRPACDPVGKRFRMFEVKA